jgi:peroxiredoxin
MANNLTGDYEAVVQVSVRKINGILSTMHQNKVNAHASDAPPTFEHSSPRVRIEDLKIPKHDTTHFAKWYAGVVQDLRETGVLPSDARSVLSEKAPPGVSSVLKKGWRDLDIIRLEPAANGAVRGTADVQLSNPTISLAERSVGEVTVHVDVRVHYDPDDGSAPMPEPIHGEVQATYIIKTKTEALSVQVSSHDNQIQFIPRTGSGLNAADADTISAQVRKVLRHQFVAADVPMPAGSRFAEFIALGGQPDPSQALAPSQAFALPLQLSDSAAGGNIHSVNKHLLGGFDFAIAVSKEYVISKFQPTLDTLRQFQKDVTVHVTDIGVVDPDYHVSVSSADLFFENGGIKLEIHAKATTHHTIAPNYNNIVIKQLIRLVLADQSVTLQASDSDLTIDGITGLFADKARSKTRSEIIDERNKALNPEPPGTPPGTVISQSFNNARKQLNETLLKFDPFSSVSYKALETNPDGIVLRGAIAPSGPGWRLDPVVDFKVAADGKSLTAFNSWIPGGRVDAYRWTWPVGGSAGAVVSVKVGHNNDEDAFDRFVLATPSDVAATGRICLRIEGTRMSPDGIEEGITAGEICKPWWSEPILTAPYGSLDVLDPIWNPPVVDQEQPLDFIVDDAIAGHVSVMGQSPPTGGLTTNTLIHFAGRNIERPLETLSHALSQMRQPHMSLVLFLVLPMGTFATRRSELQAQLGSLDERFTRNLHITEDYAGGWTKAFAAPEGPSTHLLNARGQLVWKREGKLNPDRVATALDEHLLPALAPRSVLMQLAAQPGEQAPDAFFRDDQGGCVTLRRLRGQPILLNFWKSWSKPCLRELRRLQSLQEQQGGSAPAIMAVNSEDHAALSDVRCQKNLTLRLIPDRNQSIAELYGVQCWPTTISINQEGIIDRIQFGLPHQTRETGEYAQY